jgi:hypothetical protein
MAMAVAEAGFAIQACEFPNDVPTGKNVDGSLVAGWRNLEDADFTVKTR